MTTIDLLRESLAHDAETAATPDRLTAVRARLLADQDSRRGTDAFVVDAGAGRAPRRTRPWALGIAAVAAMAVAGLVVTVFVANTQGAGSGPAGVAPASASPVDTYAFTVGADPGGWQFSYGGTAVGVQGGFWFPAGSSVAPAALNVLTGTGENPVPTRPDDATAIRIAGVNGWSAPWDEYQDAYFSLGSADTITVWRDDVSGLWAAVITAGLDASRIAELAATVHVADYHPVRSPLRAAWLPAGARLTAVSEGAGHFQLVFGPHGSQFVIGIGPAGTEEGDGETGTAPPRPLAVGSFRGSYIADDPITKVTDGRVDVVVMDGPGQAQTPGGPTAAMPLDTLTRLLAGLDGRRPLPPGDLDRPGPRPALVTAPRWSRLRSPER